MKLTCVITPAAERTVVFEEASALYAWSVYEVTVVADAFRGMTADAELVLSRGGSTYAAATLVPDPSRADVRVGTLSLASAAFTGLLSSVQADGTRVLEFDDFSFSVTCAGASVADDTVRVVVTERPDSGGGGMVVDSSLDLASTNPVENKAVAAAVADAKSAAADAKSAAADVAGSLELLASRVAALEKSVAALGAPLVLDDAAKSAISAVEDVSDSDTVGTAARVKFNKVAAAVRSLLPVESEV